MKDSVKKNIFTDSTAKQKWSFSKSRRFAQPKIHNKIPFYNNSSSLTKSQRSVSFGVGKRPSLVDKNKTLVDPGKYIIPSSFQKKNKGFSFGTGRDQTKINNYLKLIGQSPASNQYNLNITLLNKQKGVTMKQRTTYPPNYFLPNNPEAERKSKLPGPSSYKTIDTIGSKFVESRHKNFGQKFSNTQRFNKRKSYDIGPGSYDDKTISADGQYILSTMRSSGKRTIFKGYKKSMFEPKKSIPGPGEYDIVGDFGTIVSGNNQTLNAKKLSRPQTARN